MGSQILLYVLRWSDLLRMPKQRNDWTAVLVKVEMVVRLVASDAPQP